MKNKHLNQHDRIIIENSLNINLSFKAIALKVDKDCTTISKEIRHNMVLRDISCYGRIFNNCIHRGTCQKNLSVIPANSKSLSYADHANSAEMTVIIILCSILLSF
ncbi:helix-turn-helix domain-containing protein [Candidatus Stoquefichus sp. SB1]|uniref:helix-turn-helix domain-containing protein n=1 Tax=Candidatus Stoquefichus sp. SB1 TaxID=1658109 RepID=UPI0009E1A6A8